MIKAFIVFLFFYIPFAFSQETQNSVGNKDTIIINNKASVEKEDQTQTITAPALVPSSAKKLRDAREKQEIKTEDTIVRELEKQRLLDEQKRLDKLLGRQTVENNLQKPVEPVKSSEWFFGNKSFLSIGAGAVLYPHVEHINSLDMPAGFLSFGGYGYGGHLLLDVVAYYSQHYICQTTPTQYSFHPYSECLSHFARIKIDQPSLSMSVKYSPMKGRMKPYAGVTGALVFRKSSFVNRDGQALEDLVHPFHEHWTRDVGKKSWRMSYDAGLSVGADIALGDRLGLNVDFRYYLNIDTEERTSQAPYIDPLGARDSMTASFNLRYYF